MPKRKKISRYHYLRSRVPRFDFRNRLIYLKKKTRILKGFVLRRPFTSFFAVLGILFLLIILGNILLAPKPVKEGSVPVKEVQIYKLGTAPKQKFQAQVEKSGVIKIVALSGGVVSAINVEEGQYLAPQTNLISLATNYSGGNILEVSSQLAQTQLTLAKTTYDAQKEIISKQREVANKSEENASELRDISSKSADDTQSLLDLNNSILDQVNSNLANYTATNSGGINSNLIFQTKQQKAQLQGAVVQLQAQLRNLQYQANSDKPPAQLAELQKDITLRTLDLQEKTLAMNVQISSLQANLAAVNAATMHPTNPFAGIVDRIHVKVGQNVNPGTVLISLSGDTQHVKVVAKVPMLTAKNVSTVEESTININGKQVKMLPTYISQDSTDGQLYSVVYQLDDSFKSELTDLSFVTVDIPIGVADTTNFAPFIPLDSVFQTQEEAYVFIIGSDNKAVVKKIILGDVQGKFVEVLSGLPANSTVILSRNVVEGDRVEIR